ncbi:hypothetical protein PVAND_004160 [Polypedilum vanderplanki]|uniref:Elongation of very long chain fatty acids protein n=1 Tax=Polypedilum vanderplanki TaxID=319348 RepID=A0A9J6BW64_POLVA|nr:hypothetical protein PVAND_004160 [Polypedilum vanderplanki]
MALVIQKIYDGYKYFFYEIKDERSQDFFLISNPPIPFAMILIGYILMVKYGPIYMKMRKPYDLKYVMMVYNFFQVYFNVTIGIEAVYKILIKGSFNYQCENSDYSNTPRGLLFVRMSYYYFLLKVLDLMDTLFIILKKKDSHLSFLHCYHHFFMALGTYIAVRWVPGGHSTMLGIINSFVHGFMYSYYFLTAFKPELKQSIWWKKHITQIQLIQFAFLLVHYLRGALAVNCTYPKFWLWVMVIQNIFMLSLFGDFYYKAYIKKREKKSQ